MDMIKSDLIRLIFRKRKAYLIIPDPMNNCVWTVNEILHFQSGKKVTTKKTVENGEETVEVYENDVLTRRSVNGQNQMITDGR